MKKCFGKIALWFMAIMFVYSLVVNMKLFEIHSALFTNLTSPAAEDDDELME